MMSLKKDYLYKNIIQQLNDSRYVPIWVSKYMNRKNIKLTLITTKNPFHIRIYHTGSDVDEKYVKMMKTQLKRVIDYFNKHIEHIDESNRINVVFILTGRKKMIDKRKTNVIGTDNINSGLCIHTNDHNAAHIIIYRKEDLLKVFIHELIHYTGNDLRFYDDEKINRIESMIQKHIPSLQHTEIYFNEAYTEALARYHYSQFISGEKSIEQLKRQQKHSIKIVKRYLSLYNCKNLKEFASLKSYSEDSHPFSYIVIASSLLNSELFLQDVIRRRDLVDLESLVYNALLTNNKWYKQVTLKNVIHKGPKYFFKLSI